MVDGNKQWKGWLYLSPALLLLLVFTVWPIFNTVRMAFSNGYEMAKELNGTVFSIGFENFEKVIKFPLFLDCLKTTAILCVVTVPLSTLLALFIAVCLNSIKPLSKLYQTVFFLPYVTNSIAIGMVFAAMFNVVSTGDQVVNAGIINTLLSWFGVTEISDPIRWVSTGSTYWNNIFVMIVYIVWNALPFKILILLGGLQSVNKQYYDAAKVDGTSRSRVFWRITVPLLSPMISYVVITGFIGGFKEYTSIVGVFGDKMGPADNEYALQTMVGFIYQNIDKKQGVASAGALVLFCIILVITMINLYVSKKKVHY